MEGGGVFLVGGDALLLRRRLTIQTMAETLRASKAVATSTMMTTQRPGSLEASLPTLEEGTGVGGASPAWVEGEKARVTPEHAQTLHLVGVACVVGDSQMLYIYSIHRGQLFLHPPFSIPLFMGTTFLAVCYVYTKKRIKTKPLIYPGRYGAFESSVHTS